MGSLLKKKLTLISTVFFCLALANIRYAETNNNKIVETITAGSITFNKVKLGNTYVNEKTPDYEGYSVKIKIYYPQIKDPKNPAQKEWNKYIKSIWPDMSHAKIQGHYCNFSTDFSVNYTSEHIISILQKNWFYCPGTSHGWPSRNNINTIVKNGKTLKLDTKELFNPDTPWDEQLFDFSLKHLDTTARSKESEEHEELEYAKQILRWRYKHSGKHPSFSYAKITADSIGVSYSFVLGYTNGIWFADIPWEELEPYLSEDSKNYLPI